MSRLFRPVLGLVMLLALYRPAAADVVSDWNEKVISFAVARGWGLRTGEFFWEDPGVTRAVKNIGTTPINIVEFELK